MRDETLHKLKERVKELTALHKTARIIQNQTKSPDEIICEVIMLLPPAWQYPEITSARIRFMSYDVVTPDFQETEWKQAAVFLTHGGQKGSIEIFYAEERPPEDEGPFLREERELIESLAEMLRSYFEHLLSDQALRSARDNLEKEVRARTADLQRANEALQAQILEYRNAQKRIEAFQIQLRQLAAELSLAEARERHAIADDLHDHIGQALAFIKMNISQFRGNAIFCGFETNIENIMSFLDQTIRFVRNMTFEISPPILYELGLEAALEWLSERYQNQHGIDIKIKKLKPLGSMADDIMITLFKSTQELLTNAVKHSGAGNIVISTLGSESEVEIKITDDGCGFDIGILESGLTQNDRFGLLNIKIRMGYLGGAAIFQSVPRKGTTVTLTVPRNSKGR
jgi:signal transduction histidine kinase